MQTLLMGLFVTILAYIPAALTAAAETEASGLIEKTGVKGGLCLVVGAKDPALARELAAKYRAAEVVDHQAAAARVSASALARTLSKDRRVQLKGLA